MRQCRLHPQRCTSTLVKSLALIFCLPIQFAAAARTTGSTDHERITRIDVSQNRSRSILAGKKQPERCLLYGAVCNPFKGACAGDNECTTDKCYEGKCGTTPSCRPYGESCYQYAETACCTGNCKPVTLVSDCLRLLGLTDNYATHGGVNVDRQCANLGVCQHWPGVTPPPGPQSTPWAVDPQDLASKYYNLPGITFSTDAVVDKSKMVARRQGQTYENMSPDVTDVVGIKDAGLILLSADSVVELSMWAPYQLGQGAPDEVEVYCIAPILRNGAGGAFYAVGKNCCDKDAGFYCGDAEDPSVKSCIVITSDTDKYQYARQQLENLYLKPKKYTKAMNPDVPFFCNMIKDVETEMTAVRPPDMTFYTYKPLTKQTFCVAPVLRSSLDTSKPIEFFAVGVDCCNLLDGTFTCGDVDVAGAHSGKGDVDMTSDYRIAVQQGEIRFGYKSVPKPMFVRWTAEMLVPEGLQGPKIAFGKGARSMIKDAHKASLLKT